MLDRDQLEAFAAVIENQSFERAACVLNLTRGAISQRVKALEEALSTVLVVRERPILPTVAGEVVLRHVKALRLLEHDTYRHILPVSEPQDRTLVSIAVNADSLATWFGILSNEILKKLPVALEVLVEDQDHTWPLLARGEVIGCISTEAKPRQGFKAVMLGAMEYRCVAIAKFVRENFPDGFAVHRALRAPAILFNRKDSLHDTFLENVFGIRIEKYVKHYFPSPVALLEAIQAGNGYGLVPVAQACPLLNSGELIDLAPSNPMLVTLYWHHWQTEPGAAKTITELIIDAATSALQQKPRDQHELVRQP